MMFNKKQSRDIYRAAYRAMTEHSASMDVVFYFEDETARPIASGAWPSGCAVVVMENVSPSDFGPLFDPETCTEDEFVDMCMECFGNVEI